MVRPPRRLRAEVRPVAFADGESQNDEDGHRDELRPGRNVLQQCAPAQADDIDLGEDGDQEECRRRVRG